MLEEREPKMLSSATSDGYLKACLCKTRFYGERCERLTNLT